MRKRPLFLVACVFLTGLAYQRYHNPAISLFITGVLGCEVFYGIKHKNKKRMAGRSVLLLSVFLIGIVHMQQEEAFREAYMSKIEDDSQVVIWGEISKIENTDYGVRMLLSDTYISLQEEIVPCNDIMVYASSDHFHVGEIHKITGQFHRFERARNTGNFDSCQFYQSQKIDFSVWLEQSERLEASDAWIKTGLVTFRDKIENVFSKCMNPKAAGFFSGMILGDKTNLDDTLKDLFTLSGISHILAISGLHVSIIGRGLYNQLRKRGVGFGFAGILSGVLLVLYCNMVGNGMSAVRAVGMMLLFFLGQYVGRSYDMLNALGAMCLVLLWDNPFLLEYSGFWFSVMALAGVGFVGNILSAQVVQGKNLWANMGKSLWMSIGITLTTLPVVAYCYYEIPLYSPLVNFIVLPILTPVFCLALIGGVVGLWIPWLAYILLLPCSWVLGFYEWICTMVSKLPSASVITGAPTTQVVVVYYVVLFVGAWIIEKWSRRAVGNSDKNKKRRFALRDIRKCGFALVVCAVCILFIIYPKSHPFEITFLDVGQGDGIYISAGDGTTYFIDGGSTSEDLVGEYRILPFLKSKDVSAIDYWFVSHADADHISGLLEVMESGYEIRHLVMSKYVPKDENYLMLISVSEASGVELLYMDAGDKIMSDSISFTCLYPWDNIVVDRNEASLVLELEVELQDKKVISVNECVFEIDGSLRALFAGDISSETEQALLEHGVVDDVWLYKASHHGSKYSNSTELLEVLQPEISVVSCAERNNYGHPGKEAIDNMKSVGSEVFYTMENGQVTIEVDGKSSISD